MSTNPDAPETMFARLAVQAGWATIPQMKEVLASLQGRRIDEVVVERGLLKPDQVKKVLDKVRETAAARAALAQQQSAQAGGVAPSVRTGSYSSSTPSTSGRAVTSRPDGAPVASGLAPTAPAALGAARVQMTGAFQRPALGSLSATGAAVTTSQAPQPAAAPVLSAGAVMQQNAIGAMVAELASFSAMPMSTQEGGRWLDRVLLAAMRAGASDVHVHAKARIRIRVGGILVEVGDELSAELTERELKLVLDEERCAHLDKSGQIDLALTVAGVGRFRSNLYKQQRGFNGAFRVLPAGPPLLSEIGMPAALSRVTQFHQGIVLFTGPTGCGKSTTLAAIVRMLNEERDDHILTIEDPIEILHTSKRCIVNQRQAGQHTDSFARALRAALREDPDVIVIGEMRDLETISLALTAAETGHLVLASLHTPSAVRTIGRLVGVYPPSQQSQIRTMLSESLRAVVSQRLVVRADGGGRIPALELLYVNQAVGNLIRENRAFQIKSVLQTGSASGMCSMEASLLELVAQGLITKEEAARHAEDPKKFA